jgi:hypothetical protein
VCHEHDAVVVVGEFRHRLCVSLEPAVVLYLAVFDRRIQVEADEYALFCVEVVERVERSHLTSIIARLLLSRGRNPSRLTSES